MCDTLIFWLNIVFGFNPLFEFIFVVTSVSSKLFYIGWHNDEVYFSFDNVFRKSVIALSFLTIRDPF